MEEEQLKRSKFVVKNGRSRGAKIQKEWGLLGYPAGCIEPGVNGFVELFSPACVSGSAWLGLLACLLGCTCVSVVGWGVVGVVGLRDGLCWATWRCICQDVRGGIAHTRRRSCLKFLFPFHLACKVPFCLLVLTSPRHDKGGWVMGNVCASV